MNVLGIDIGGSGIKGALVDLKKGKLITERHRIPTPSSRLPKDVLPVIKELVDHFKYSGPVGIGFPAIVANGIPLSPFTALEIMEWKGYPVAKEIKKLTKCPISLLNDADAAGLAEMHFGAGKGVDGTVVTITLGTGVGSGLFVNGQLVKNSEFGKLYLPEKKRYSEYYMADSAREREELSWEKWGKRVNAYLNHLEFLLTPELIIIGGGVSKKFHKYEKYIKLERTPVVPAKLLNQAGIVGAAMATQVEF